MARWYAPVQATLAGPRCGLRRSNVAQGDNPVVSGAAPRSDVDSEREFQRIRPERPRLHRQCGTHADRQVRRGAREHPGGPARRRRDRSRGRTRPPAGRRDRRGPHGPGAPGGGRPGAGPEGRAARGPARNDERDDDQSGLRLGPQVDHARRRGDSRGRRRGRGRRRHGIDESRAVPAPEGEIRAIASATAPLLDATIQDGLWCTIEDCHMGTHAERVAIKTDVSRADQDACALMSHQRAIAAMDAGRFADEMAPVTVADSKGRETIVDTDEGPRRDTSAEALARLKPVFELPDRPDRGDATDGHRHGRQLAGHHRRRRRDRRRERARRGGARPQAARPDRRLCPGRGRAEVAVPRAGRGRRKLLEPHRHDDRSIRPRSRSTRPSRPRPWPTGARSASTGTRPTSTAARSRSAIRSAPRERESSRPCSTSSAGARAGTGSRRSASVVGVRSRRHSNGSTDRG